VGSEGVVVNATALTVAGFEDAILGVISPVFIVRCAEKACRTHPIWFQQQPFRTLAILVPTRN
jgi:hypothetical protein